MELIGTAQRELQRQAQEEMDMLNRSKNTLINELNTKNTLISNLMNFKQLDYQTASAEYNNTFSQNLQMLNYIQGVEAQEFNEAQQLQNVATANLTTMTQLMANSGKTWSDLDPTMQAKISQLEIQSGLPTGSIQSFMNTKPNASIMATVNGVDAEGNDIVSFIYENPDGSPGIVQTVKTGGVAGVNGGTGEGTDTTGLDNKTKETILSKITSAVSDYQKNPDGYREPFIERMVSAYGEEYRDYISKQTYSAMGDIVNEQFINPDYISTNLKTRLKTSKVLDASGVAGFWKSQEAEYNDLVNKLIQLADNYRTAGYTDKEIWSIIDKKVAEWEK